MVFTIMLVDVVTGQPMENFVRESMKYVRFIFHPFGSLEKLLF